MKRAIPGQYDRATLLDLLLRTCRLPDRDGLVDIAIADGRIVGIGADLGPAREVVEVAGRVVTPGLVEAHIHLDKALLSERIVRAAAARWTRPSA